MSASVDYHSELAKDHSTTKGGGWWELKENNLFLYGSSTDYGPANIEDIKSSLRENITSIRVHSWNVFFSSCQTLAEAIATGIKIKSASA